MAYAYCTGLEGVRGFGTVVHCTTYEQYLKAHELGVQLGRDTSAPMTREQWRKSPGVYECSAPSGPVDTAAVIASSLAHAGGGMVAAPAQGTVQRTVPIQDPRDLYVRTEPIQAARIASPAADPMARGFSTLTVVGVAVAAAAVVFLLRPRRR